MDLVNHQFRLAARPVGLPKPSDWEFTEESVSEPGDGEVLVKILYLSLDPAMRGWMSDARSYVAPVGIGEVMRAGGVGEVLVSNHPDLAAGDHVTGMLGVQEYAVAHGNAVTKLDASLVPLPTYLGTLGMPGLTAYFGLLDIGRPVEGETVGSRAAPRSAATWWRTWVSMRRSTTRLEGLPLLCASTLRRGSTSTSTTSAVRSSTTRSPAWRVTRA
jgi:NADPH-dependent curcumin reductase